ncbi:MAG: FeoB-associated Cys-rich membrane protein [Sphaerochaetaceae bacterium]|jgi:hypothetical protein
MANVIVSIIIFGSLGLIAYRMLKSRKSGGSSCHSGCGSCPYACEEKPEH